MFFSPYQLLEVSPPQRPLLHLDVSVQQEPLSVSLYEIFEILYMKVITEFRKILSNYATRNSMKLRGILGNFAQNTKLTGVQKQMEFRVDGIPWTP
jgi:hypothetical protein